MFNVLQPASRSALHIIIKLWNIPYGSIASILAQHGLFTCWMSMHYSVACDISEWHILHFSSWSILVLHLRGTILFNWLEWLVLCLCRLIVIYRMDLKSISIILGKNTHKTQLMACTTICALSLIITKKKKKKERDWIKNIRIGPSCGRNYSLPLLNHWEIRWHSKNVLNLELQRVWVHELYKNEFNLFFSFFFPSWPNIHNIIQL